MPGPNAEDRELRETLRCVYCDRYDRNDPPRRSTDRCLETFGTTPRRCSRERWHAGYHVICKAREDSKIDHDAESWSPAAPIPNGTGADAPEPDETLRGDWGEVFDLFERSLATLREIQISELSSSFDQVLGVAVLTKLSLDLWIERADEAQEEASKPSAVRLAFESGVAAAIRSQLSLWRSLASIEGNLGTLEGIHTSKRIADLADRIEKAALQPEKGET